LLATGYLRLASGIWLLATDLFSGVVVTYSEPKTLPFCIDELKKTEDEDENEYEYEKGHKTFVLVVVLVLVLENSNQ
jgi:hypothetical protein